MLALVKAIAARRTRAAEIDARVEAEVAAEIATPIGQIGLALAHEKWYREHPADLPVAVKPRVYTPRKSYPPVPASMRLAVCERDGWICQLCLEPVDRTRRGLHPDAPSMDHIVLKSRGGQNTLENLRLAHVRCNQARYNPKLHPPDGRHPGWRNGS